MTRNEHTRRTDLLGLAFYAEPARTFGSVFTTHEVMADALQRPRAARPEAGAVARPADAPFSLSPSGNRTRPGSYSR